jgi:hypothetical protein
MDELELELPKLTVKELTKRAKSIGIADEKIQAAVGADDKAFTLVGGFTDSVNSAIGFGDKKLAALGTALANAVT